jgi:hypothetical protein
VYNIPQDFSYSNQYRTGNYGSPSFGAGTNMANYSPSRYAQPPVYTGANFPASNFTGYQAPAPQPQENFGTLLNNIDQVLAGPSGGYSSQIRPYPSPPREYSSPARQPMYQTMTNTFSRAENTQSFRPNFEMHAQYSPARDPVQMRHTQSYAKPPIYRPRSVAQRQQEQITNMNDFYNRKPPIDRYSVNNNYAGQRTPYGKFWKYSCGFNGSL